MITASCIHTDGMQLSPDNEIDPTIQTTNQRNDITAKNGNTNNMVSLLFNASIPRINIKAKAHSMRLQQTENVIRVGYRDGLEVGLASLLEESSRLSCSLAAPAILFGIKPYPQDGHSTSIPGITTEARNRLSHTGHSISVLIITSPTA